MMIVFRKLMLLEVASATRRPAVPVKLATAFWPGTVVVSVTGGPPGLIAAVASGGTLKSWIAMLPPPACSGCTRTT